MSESDHLVVTIGRECGSGGRQIGKAVAERMGISFYDEELLSLAAKNSGLCEDIFRTHDEKPVSSFLYSLVVDSYSLGYVGTGYSEDNMPLNQRVFLAQFDTIRQLAEQESCVIVGRCADYALAEHPNTMNIFISGEEEDKVHTLMKRYDMTEDKARSYMNKTDKQRASYYNFYTNKKWGSVDSYDMCINSSRVGMDRCVNLIVHFAYSMVNYKPEKSLTSD